MPEPMVLGYLTSQYGRAADSFIRQEVRQLRKLGHSVVTFSIRRPDPEQVVSADIRDEQDRTHYLLDAGLFNLVLSALAMIFRHPLRMARAVALACTTSAPGLKGHIWQIFYLFESAHLARKIKRFRVEHIHNHIAQNSASVCMLAAVLADVSWSMTVHGPHDFVDPERWALSRKLESAAFSVFIAEFGRSQAMWHSPQGVWPKLKIVRCGLDEMFLENTPVPIPAAPRILFVGRLSPEKGVLLLIDAVEQLARDNIKVELTIIGDGPSYTQIKNAIERYQLEDSVTLAGWGSSEKVRDEIIASRALVLPSFAEGLPVVLMEALALHRPVISTYVAGIPELVKPGINGFLVAPGSLEDLVEAIRSAVTASTEKLALMGKNGADLVKERHNAAANALQLEQLLWNVVHETRASISQKKLHHDPAT